MTVSVVIPHHNDPQSLSRALASVVAQTMRPDEILVVDDASSPKNREAVRRINSDFPGVTFYYLSTNRGPAYARNFGWDRASSDFVAFLDADDVWHSRKLELQVAIIQSDAAMVAIGGGYRRVHANTDLANSTPTDAMRTPSSIEFLMHNPLATSTVLLKRNIRARFPTSQRYAEDYSLWIELSRTGKIGVLTCDVAGRFKRAFGDNGLSAHMWRMLGAEASTYISLRRRRILSAWESVLACTVLVPRGARRLSQHWAHRLIHEGKPR